MDAIQFNDRLFRNSFTEAEYDSLEHFFQDIWLNDAPYKVFMARRAFNLNYAFMDITAAHYKAEYKTEGIISNTALLLCAEEIAEYYRRTGDFPQIILADDLLIHGRGIMKLINNLESLVAGFLRGMQNCTVSEGTIHSKLLGVISIYVYAQNLDGILLDKQASLKSVLQLPIAKLRALSQKISRALQRCGVANTSYVLSAELPWGFYQQEYERGIEEGTLFPYRGNTLRYYYCRSRENFLSTVRFYRSDGSVSPMGIATSLTVFGDIAYQEDDPNCAFNALCRDVAKELHSIIPYSRINSILCYQDKFLTRPRAQLLSYLLSIIGYCEFYRKKVSDNSQALYKSLIQSDYHKIAANFDRPQKLQCEFVQLFRHVSQAENLFSSRIYELMERYAGELRENAWQGLDDVPLGDWIPGETGGSPQRTEQLHEFAEDIFYEVGMDAECDANQCAQQEAAFDPTKPGNDFIRLERYLSIMKHYGSRFPSSIGCVLNLMDSGLMAMNLDLAPSGEAIRCILKAGELSTFVLPRRFSVFVPALSTVEREYAKVGTSRRAVISRFIDYLRDHCYQQDGSDSPEDLSLLAKLSRSKVPLLYMYVVGQRFRDWDVNLLTEEDRFSHGIDEWGNFSAEKYSSWIASETKRIRYYNYCAKSFLHSERL